MKVQSLISLVILAINMNGQAPDWNWSKSVGGNQHEQIWSTTIDASGNIYAAGNFSSPFVVFGSTTLTNTGSNTSDIFLVKYDPSGNVLWAKSYGTSNNDEGRFVVLDGLGNVFFAGYYNGAALSMGGFTLPNNGYDDIFVAKTDPSGVLQWATGIGGQNDNRPGGIALSSSGDLLLAGGYSEASLTVGTYTLTNAGNFDIACIIMSASTGSVSSAKGFGSSGRDEANVVSTNNNGFQIGGWYNSPSLVLETHTLVNANSGTYDAFLFELNNNSVSFAVGFGGSGNEEITAITTRTVNSVPEICIAGDYTSPSITLGSMTLTNSMPGNTDIFIAGYVGNNASWAKTAGENSDEGVYGLIHDANNNLYITGGFLSSTIAFGSTTLTNSGPANSVDIFVAAYDLNASSIWALRAGGSGQDLAYSIASEQVNSSACHLVVSGLYDSPSLAFGSNPALNNGGGSSFDLFIAKLIPSTTTGLNTSYLGEDWRLFPNPVSDLLTIERNDPETTSIIIYNSLGKIVFQEELSKTRVRIDLRDIPPGIYFASVKGDGDERWVKLLKL